MPKASEHRASRVVKALFIGDSATGKTTSLISLLCAGYKLRVYDYDNLLSPLVAMARAECPEKLDNLEYMPFRDKFKATQQGPVIDGQPTAMVNGMKALNVWEDGTKPVDWPDDHVIVIDSLTSMARSAYWWARSLQGAAGVPEGVSMKGFEPRTAFFTAQSALENFVSMITAESFPIHVIMVAHIQYLTLDGIQKGFPYALGEKLAPKIPTYFPSVFQMQRSGDRRTIRVKPTNMLDLKNPKSFETADEYPASTGLADIFAKLRA